VPPAELDAFYAAGNTILAEGREELTIRGKH
jgi:hypothetical protein